MSKISAQSGMTDSSEEPLFRRKNLTTDVSIHHGLFVAVYFCTVLIIGLVVRDYAIPFQRGFFCNDETIRYPYKNEAVTDPTLYGVTVIGTIAIICFIEAARIFCFEKRYFGKTVLSPDFSVLGREIHPYLARCYYFIAVAAVAIVTDVFVVHLVKPYAGRLRPHFIDACQPDWSRINCTDPYGYPALVLDPHCTTSIKDVNYARKSWPSGHASTTAMVFVYNFLYLRVRVPELKHHLYVPAGQLVIFMMTLMTCVSRVDDNMHHVFDVISGATIGVLEGLFFCIMYGQFLQLPVWITKFTCDEERRKNEEYEAL